jgi:hypothetical protein
MIHTAYPSNFVNKCSTKQNICRLLGLFAMVSLSSGCATSNTPVRIGGDTYYSSGSNMAGAFGDPSEVATKLIREGNAFCATQKREFELVTKNISPSRIGSGLGGADITFKCVTVSTDVRLRNEPNVLIEDGRKR